MLFALKWLPTRNRCCGLLYSKYLVLLFGICIILVYLAQIEIFLRLYEQVIKISYHWTINDLPTDYLINTPGCKILKFPVFAPEIKEYIFEPNDFHGCNNRIRPLFDSNKTSIFLTEDALEDYKIANLNDIHCCYRYFKRKNPKIGQKDIQIKYADECVHISKMAHVDPTEDFLRIMCNETATHKLIYEDYFHFISKLKNDIEENSAQPVQKDVRKREEKKLNVLILGVDAVSRLNLHRQMPRTVQYLESLSAIELLGYNKIGDNSCPNVYAVLTGYDDIGLFNACLKSWTSYFDNCKFIWQQYKAAGYVTGFGEDTAWMGFFKLGKRRGFINQPTDYYYDHFDYIAYERIGTAINTRCLGSRLSYEVLLNYVENFVFAMKEKRKTFFGFFWTAALTHDYLNYPRLGDFRISQLLKDFHTKDIFEDTAFILMSDHGVRFGEFRKTYQGSVEERLPFVYIVLPEWYKKNHPEFIRNLNDNRNKLTTPYDLHKTLKVLLNPESPAQDAKLGISLFSNISNERTCEDAGIKAHWCTCHQSVRVNVTDTNVMAVVNYTVNEHINKMLLVHPECSQLTLLRVIDARKNVNIAKLGQYDENIHDYMVTFQTVPGGAILEATVRKTIYNEDLIDYAVSGTVSRLNKYGTQSDCITYSSLKLYCYCK